jgi:sortase A
MTLSKASPARTKHHSFPRKPFAAVLLAAAFFCWCLALSAAWVPAKAELAQWLIERSWNGVTDGVEPPAPWPWADTRPAALLEAPGHGVRLVVLEGNSGRNLAFGPVFGDGTADGRDMVINGHRDTHFDFLAHLQTGDRLMITRRDGAQVYEVVQADIVDSRSAKMVIDPGLDRVSLVTCYPFDSPSAGGPLRYVVTALPVSPRSVSSG